jgi:phosphopantothenoylcysteine decarboxylase
MNANPGTRLIVLGVTGSIAACKSPELVSQLRKAGFDVRVAMTDAAQRFVTPFTLQTLSQHPVATTAWERSDGWKPLHIDLADSAHLFLIAPATANTIAELAHGLAGNPLTEIALATRAPVVIAPAMNGKMWEHPATRANVSLLRERGVQFIEPEAGILACGYEGIGRLASVEEIVACVTRLLDQAH